MGGFGTIIFQNETDSFLLKSVSGSDGLFLSRSVDRTRPGLFSGHVWCQQCSFLLLCNPFIFNWLPVAIFLNRVAPGKECRSS